MPADTPVCICKFSPENTELCRNEAKASWVPPTDRPQYRHMLLLPIFKQFDKIVYCHIYKIYCFFMSHDAVQKVLFASSLMVRGVFLSSCIPDSCLGIKKVCCLFPADINFNQFIGLLFPVSFFHPTPDVWVGSRPSCSIFLFHPSEASLTQGQPQSLECNYTCTQHQGKWDKENWPLPWSHAPIGNEPCCFAGSLVKTVQEGEGLLVPCLFLSSSGHLASPLYGDRAEGFNGRWPSSFRDNGACGDLSWWPDCGSLTGTRTCGGAIGASRETELRHDSTKPLIQERTRTLKEWRSNIFNSFSSLQLSESAHA